jgi:hypothetical protein
MQYTLSLTTRMMTIAGLCLLLLCVLLFLLGVEIGKRISVPTDGVASVPAVVIPATASPVVPATAGDAPSAPANAKP